MFLGTCLADQQYSSFIKTLKGEELDVVSKAYVNQAKWLFEDAYEKGFLKQQDVCTNRLQEILNNFEQHSGILGRMVYFSGKDINDLGRFEE